MQGEALQRPSATLEFRGRWEGELDYSTQRYSPLPLEGLAIGQSDFIPYLKISISSKQTFFKNDEIENPVHLMSGRFRP